MDWLFNLQIPQSTDKKLVIRPRGKTFITGIASSYFANYDENVLKDTIDETLYYHVLNTINKKLQAFWPCCPVIWFGYLLAPFTCGLSFFLPNYCISDATSGVQELVGKLNRTQLFAKNLELIYVSAWSTSWLELHVLTRE